MSLNEGQQPIIETTGREVPETSADYQAMVVKPIPGYQERWNPTEGEPTLDVPVVRVDGAQSDSEPVISDTSESSEQEVPAHPGEFDEKSVTPVVRDRAGASDTDSESRRPGRIRKGIATGLAFAALGTGITGAVLSGTGDTKVNATRDDKTEQEETEDKYSGIITPGAEIGGADLPAEAETQTVEATPGTDETTEVDAKNIESTPTTTAPYPGQEAPVANGINVLPSNTEIVDNNAEVEKAALSVVMLADFFMGNEPLTGLSPVIEMGEGNSLTLTYSGEGFSVSITGEGEDGFLKQNPLDSLRGFHGITVTDEGKTVSTMMDTATGLPALQFIVDGVAFTTNGKIYPNAKLDKALVVGNVQQVAYDVQLKVTQ